MFFVFFVFFSVFFFSSKNLWDISGCKHVNKRKEKKGWGVFVGILFYLFFGSQGGGGLCV